MEEIIINAIHHFLDTVLDFSEPVALCINKKEQKAIVDIPDDYDSNWDSFPIRNFVKLDDKGFLEPDKDAIVKFVSEL